MPPPVPPTPTLRHNHFDNAHPIQLTTWRPRTWYALETFLEFLITGYCLWAAFYLIYISICFAVWVVRKVKDWMNPWRTVGKERKERDDFKLGRRHVRRWWHKLRHGKREEGDVRMNRESGKDGGAQDWDERTRVQRRTV